MANFAQDDFSTETILGTPLIGNNDQFGNTWASGSGAGNLSGVIDTTPSPHAYGSNQNFVDTWCRNPGTPPSADYTVQCDIIASDGNSLAAGVMGRLSSGAFTAYIAFANGFGPYWELDAVVAGTKTILGTSAQTFVTNTQYLALQLIMSGTTIKLAVNGTTLITVTDSSVSAAGFSGVWAVSDATTSGLIAQNFSAFPNASSVVFRRTLSQFGTRTGSRQVMLG